MASRLLTTKFTIPQLRSDLVHRPRLIAKLNAGLNGRLTCVSAPAGFGKTTLIVAWLQQLPFSNSPWEIKNCAWVSLDEHDNEPVRFLQYLIAASRAIYPDLGIGQLNTLENSPNPSIEAITQDWLNEIASNDQPLLIVLDDYHEIKNQLIHQILQTTVEFLPSQVYLVVTTRQDPPFSLPRWRARNWLCEITATDLRFDFAEANDFLQQTMQLELSSEAVTLLETRTEGWVAGLQLAALSLGDTDFSPEEIQQFSGRDRYVAEYLLSEVLDHQSSEIQQFLLRSAILERFNADLCAAILPSEPQLDSIHYAQEYQNLIATLERSNLFVIPLDREGYWYRYHHLFTQLLRQRLERTWEPDEIRVLYRRAAHWFAAQGFVEEAVNYALQGEDYVFTAHLITAFEADSLWNQTWGVQLRKWGEALPSDILQEFPKAALYIALVHMTRNEIKQAVHYIELVRENPRVKAEILLIDSIFVRNQGDISQALTLANEAAVLFEPRDKPLYVAAQTQVIVCLMTLGELTAAEDLAISVRQKIQTESGQFFNVYIQLIQILGIIKEQRGMLLEAERIYLEGIETIAQSGKAIPLVGLLQARLGAIYYQWNEIEKATEHCQAGLLWGDRTGITDLITHASLVQVNLAILRRDEVTMDATLERLSKLRDWPEFNDLDSLILANRAYIDIRLGNLSPAIRWADSSGFSSDDQLALRYRMEYQTLARVRYEEYRQLGLKDQAPKVVALVDKLLHLATGHQIVDLAVDCLALKALLYDFQGQTKNAIAALHEALDLAFPGGFIRAFIDFGVPMRDLLQKSLVYEPHMVYKRRLLLIFNEAGVTRPNAISVDREIPITLTPREAEILQLIAAGLSNKAIQESLMLSKNTVRTHLKNLYSKLGVHSRTQAVQQARESGLI